MPKEMQISQERTEFLALWQELAIRSLSLCREREPHIPNAEQGYVGGPWAQTGSGWGEGKPELSPGMLQEAVGEKRNLFSSNRKLFFRFPPFSPLFKLSKINVVKIKCPQAAYFDAY